MRDFKIASEARVPEVIFRFCYDTLLKAAIAVCAKNGLRVKARKGHHYELINRLAEFIGDDDVNAIGNEMRSKRNWDLYGGGFGVSKKEAREYLRWTKAVVEKVEKYLRNDNQKRLL